MALKGSFTVTVRAVLTSVAIAFVSTASAQMTDKQLLRYLEQQQQANIPHAVIVREAAARGAGQAQVERVMRSLQGTQANQTGEGSTLSAADRIRLNQNQTAGMMSPADQSQVVPIDSLSMSPEDYRIYLEDLKRKEKEEKENSIYGRSEFFNQNLTFQPNMNLPTPVNYQLGSGDEIMIDIWGESQMSLRQVISPDGYVVLSNIGPVHLAGLEIAEAQAKLKQEFGRILSGLNNGRSFIRLSLGEVRTIQVNIMGEANMPGTYTLSSFSTVFNAMHVAGGTSDIGSLRDIKVFRGGKVLTSVDMYSVLMNGSGEGDVILREGDIVKVESFKNMVKISGLVRRPMRYEMKESETLADLIRFAGGFDGQAYKASLHVTRMGSSQRRVYDVDSEDYATFGLQDGDQINAGAILDRYDNRVEILGAVHREGEYAIGPGIQTVGDLFRAAGGARGDALLGRVSLYRENPDLTTRLQPVNVGALLEGKIDDIPLLKNDRVTVPSMNDIYEARTLAIYGDVQSPGLLPYADNTTVKDLILRVGGLLESASWAQIDISRRIRNPLATNESATIGKVITMSLKNGVFGNDKDEDRLVVDGDTILYEDFLLEPYDEVVVRRSPGYQPQQNVTVQGEVLFPGTYTLLSINERLSSVIERAGGITSLAFPQGARLIREHDELEKAKEEAAMRIAERQGSELDSISFSTLEAGETYTVGIDLIRAMANKGGHEDIVLRPGDVITVPGETGVVKISGAVLFPNAVTYRQKLRLSDYIRNAGGYSDEAKSSKVYVLYMNGNTSKGRMSKIEPGCEIIVPYKVRKERMSAGEVVSLSASVTSVVALVFSIVQNSK